MKNLKTFAEEVEAQQLITNINLMRLKIGVSIHSFNFLYKKSIEELRSEQESTILHYNEAIKNSMLAK